VFGNKSNGDVWNTHVENSLKLMKDDGHRYANEWIRAKEPAFANENVEDGLANTGKLSAVST